MLSFIKCFERVLIKIILDLFPDIPPDPWGVSLCCSYFAIGMNEMNEMNFFFKMSLLFLCSLLLNLFVCTMFFHNFPNVFFLIFTFITLRFLGCYFENFFNCFLFYLVYSHFSSWVYYNNLLLPVEVFNFILWRL